MTPRLKNANGFILVAMVTTLLFVVMATAEAETSNIQNRAVFHLSEEDAKTFLQAPHLRYRRGLGGWIHGMTRGRENVEKANQRIARAKELLDLHQAAACKQNCWAPWGEWSACNHKCNSGVRKRTRNQDIKPNCAQYGCPGRVEEVQKCVMDCGSDGQESRGACVCQRGYYGDCCNQVVTCQKPRKPANGNLGNVLSWPAKYNFVVTYDCEEGYDLIGSSDRKCQLNGAWSGESAICKQIQCPNIETPPHGALINQKGVYLHGNKVGYKCDLGFDLGGVESRTCGLGKNGVGKWTAFDPACYEKNCGDPGDLANGIRQGDDFTYDGLLMFNCRRGFTLIGSSERKCLSTGVWSGQQPICAAITCPSIDGPINGAIVTKNNSVDSTLNFQCHHGYELEGSETLTCLENGTWDGRAPICNAITCGDPGKPQYGARIDSGFHLDQVVQFTCFDGYVLEGPASTKCLASRQWSKTVPICKACEKDFYQSKSRSGPSVCVKCPTHSHTVTSASARMELCLCEDGFRGRPGGPCEEIVCPNITAPAHGTIFSCGLKLGEKCVFRCESGYILVGGSSVRTCAESGEWDGQLPTCKACPVNTYQAAAGSCLPCPRHTHTVGTAAVEEGCICDIGYGGPPGGPCVDLDECLPNEGLGPCEQRCINTQGSFKCQCVIPGYRLDDDDRTCFPSKQCKNLTEAEAPQNGGLLCHWYLEENSQQCSVKCNNGYELPMRTNAYETCGPATGFTWSFRRVDKNATITVCIEEFFPDFHFEAESAYFVRQCSNLTEDEKQEVKREFAQRLTDEGICIKRRSRICDMRNVGIICGRTTRKRRDVTGQEVDHDVIDISFDVFAKKKKVPTATLR